MPKLNPFRTLKHDYALLFSFLVVILIPIFLFFTTQELNPTGLKVFLSIEALFVALGICRLLVISSYFRQGTIIKGKVIKVWFFRDRGRVIFQYAVDGLIYQRSMAVMKTQETRSFTVGQQARILVKTNHPKKAILIDLFVG
ncbi:MAG: hypothetical protein PHP32_00410 [Candidatus Izemoplasmatales bacterium]|nr:hypothetical protein [Candidatus Izemoplasmatales bacterium]